MKEEIIDLVARRSPLPKIKFPTGRVLQVMEHTPPMERIYRELLADPENETKVRAVLSALVPDATDDDWESCVTEDYQRIVEVAVSKRTAAMAIVEARRKNDGGETGGSPTKKKKTPPPGSPRSSRTMTSTTSAPASGA